MDMNRKHSKMREHPRNVMKSINQSRGGTDPREVFEFTCDIA